MKKNESIAQKAFRMICQPTFPDLTITACRFTEQFNIHTLNIDFRINDIFGL